MEYHKTLYGERRKEKNAFVVQNEFRFYFGSEACDCISATYKIAYRQNKSANTTGHFEK